VIRRIVSALTSVPTWAVARAPAPERHLLSCVACCVALDYVLFANVGATIAADSGSVWTRCAIGAFTLLVGSALLAFDQMLSSISGDSPHRPRPAARYSFVMLPRILRITAVGAIGIAAVQCFLAAVLDTPLRRAESLALVRSRKTSETALLTQNSLAIARVRDRVRVLSRPVSDAAGAVRYTDSLARRAKSPRAIESLRAMVSERREELQRMRIVLQRELEPLEAERTSLEVSRDSTIRALSAMSAYAPSAAGRIMRLPAYLPWSIPLSLLLLPVPVLPVVLRARHSLNAVKDLLAAEQRVVTLRAYRALTIRYASSLREFTAPFAPRAHPFSDAPWNTTVQPRTIVTLQEALVSAGHAALTRATGTPRCIVGRAFLICRTEPAGRCHSPGGSTERLVQTSDTHVEITHASFAGVPAPESFDGRATLRLPLVRRALVTPGERDVDGPWAVSDLNDVVLLNPVVLFHSGGSPRRVVGITGLLVSGAPTNARTPASHASAG